MVLVPRRAARRDAPRRAGDDVVPGDARARPAGAGDGSRIRPRGFSRVVLGVRGDQRLYGRAVRADAHDAARRRERAPRRRRRPVANVFSDVVRRRRVRARKGPVAVLDDHGGVRGVSARQRDARLVVARGRGEPTGGLGGLAGPPPRLRRRAQRPIQCLRVGVDLVRRLLGPVRGLRRDLLPRGARGAPAGQALGVLEPGGQRVVPQRGGRDVLRAPPGEVCVPGGDRRGRHVPISVQRARARGLVRQRVVRRQRRVREVPPPHGSLPGESVQGRHRDGRGTRTDDAPP